MVLCFGPELKNILFLCNLHFSIVNLKIEKPAISAKGLLHSQAQLGDNGAFHVCPLIMNWAQVFWFDPLPFITDANILTTMNRLIEPILLSMPYDSNMFDPHTNRKYKNKNLNAMIIERLKCLHNNWHASLERVFGNYNNDSSKIIFEFDDFHSLWFGKKKNLELWYFLSSWIFDICSAWWTWICGAQIPEYCKCSAFYYKNRGIRLHNAWK